MAIEHDKRSELSKLISRRRAELGWSYERLAAEATEALWREAISERATEAERELWEHFEITIRAVTTLENHPRSPLGSPAKRARLLGVALALGLDRGIVNRLAGGL